MELGPQTCPSDIEVVCASGADLVHRDVAPRPKLWPEMPRITTLICVTGTLPRKEPDLPAVVVYDDVLRVISEVTHTRVGRVDPIGSVSSCRVATEGLLEDVIRKVFAGVRIHYDAGRRNSGSVQPCRAPGRRAHYRSSAAVPSWRNLQARASRDTGIGAARCGIRSSFFLELRWRSCRVDRACRVFQAVI